MKRTVGVLFFVISIFTFAQLSFAQNLADVPLDPTYCDGAYYTIPDEPARCSRAPQACGNGYDEINTSSLMPNPQSCTSNPNACGGKPPLCCYEMARTGDFTKCIGYWERLWCPKVLCDQAKANGASDSQCGGSCQCSHAFSSYCGDNVSIVPLSQRIAGITATQPSSTPTRTPTRTPTPTPTRTPTRTPTPTPTTPPGVTVTATPTTQPGTITPTSSQPTATTAPGQPTPTTPPGQPSPTPTTTVVPCTVQKVQGNYNCTGSVDEADFTVWKEDFGNKSTTLAFFEYWRRAAQP